MQGQDPWDAAAAGLNGTATVDPWDEAAASLPPEPSFGEKALETTRGLGYQAVAGLAEGVGGAAEFAGRLGSRVGNAIFPGETTQAERKRRLQRGGPITSKVVGAGQELKREVSSVPPPQGVAQTVVRGAAGLAPALIAPEAAIPYFGAMAGQSLERVYDDTLSKTGNSATAFEAMIASVPVEAVQFYGPLKAAGVGGPAAWTKPIAAALSKLSPKVQQVAVKMIEGAVNGGIGQSAASVGHDVIASELGGEDLTAMESAGKAMKAAGYGAAIVGLIGGAHALVEGVAGKPGAEAPTEAANRARSGDGGRETAPVATAADVETRQQPAVAPSLPGQIPEQRIPGAIEVKGEAPAAEAAKLPELPSEAVRVAHTETPEFKAWFGKSKVMDEGGKPLVVYHGTPKPGFEAFDPQRAEEFNRFTGKDPVAGFFTDKANVAAMYAKEEGATYPAYLGIKKPLVIGDEVSGKLRALDARKLIQVMRAAGDTRAAEYAERNPTSTHDMLTALAESKAGTVATIKAAGFDGMKATAGRSWNRNTGVDDAEPHSIWIAFHPEQVKSAIGNSGRFDPKSPDLRDPAPPPEIAPAEAKPETPKAPPAPEIVEQGKAEPVPPSSPSLGAEGPAKATSIKDSQLEADRAALNLPPVVKEAAKEFGPVWEETGKRLAEDPALAEQVLGGKHVEGLKTHEREAMLLRLKVHVENEAERLSTALDKAVQAGDTARVAELRPLEAAARDSFDRTIQASQEVISESGRSLSFVRMMARNDFTLAALERQERISTGKPITDVQRSEIKALHDELAALESNFEAFKAKRDAALSERATKRVAADPAKRARVLTILDAEADAARARLKSKLGRAGGGIPIDPGMILDLAKIAASHIAHGIDAGARMLADFGEQIKPHLDDILARAKAMHDSSVRKEAALAGRPKRMQKTLGKLEAKEASGQVAPDPKPERVPLNPEEQKIQSDIERVRERLRQRFLKNEQANRTKLEKAQDTLVKWRRGFVLSGVSTLAKLTSAAGERMGITAIEEGVGRGIGKLVPKLAERAPREGGGSVRIEAQAIAEGFTKGLEDSWKTIRTGKSDLDALYGKEGYLPPEAIDFLGTIHSALKAPAKRNEFTRSFAKRTEWAIRNGIDPTDPAVQTRLALDAYKDANRSIFLQDNRVVSAYKAAIRMLESPNKDTGRPSQLGKAGATAAKVLLPIVKVPTNIVSETFQYAAGSLVGPAEAIRAYRRGIETLSPAEADIIMRHLKKGSLGAAVLLLGYLRADQVGGYYSGKRDEKDVKPGSIRLFGWDVPPMLVHNPLFEVAQIGATIRRIADSKRLKGDEDTQGHGAGALAALFGLLEEVPFIRTPLELGEAFDPNKRPGVMGRTAESLVVPIGLSWLARQIDKDEQGETVKRDPKTINDYIKSGIPGLRETLPEKSEKPRGLRKLSIR